MGLIYLGFYLWERRNKNNVVTTGPDPVEVVKMRYARGEISAEEYHRLKEELRKE
ncbi:SHOCT domain-containing protein [Desulfofundulus kuznetsovii]|uniref:SHOCT domain-containing protein n=1 Tax=Desulfofundulus kuznetsovii TaxID=58135 RepID=UPI00338D3CC9